MVIRKRVQRWQCKLDLHCGVRVSRKHFIRKFAQKCIHKTESTNLGVEDNGEDGKYEKYDGDEDGNVEERWKRKVQSVHHNPQTSGGGEARESYIVSMYVCKNVGKHDKGMCKYNT